MFRRLGVDAVDRAATAGYLAGFLMGLAIGLSPFVNVYIATTLAGGALVLGCTLLVGLRERKIAGGR